MTGPQPSPTAAASGPRPTMVMRPVQVTRSDRNKIEAIAASLRKRRFTKDAEALERIVQRWDGAEGMVILPREYAEDLVTRARANERAKP